MREEWVPILGFERYSISDAGNVCNEKTGRILRIYPNQYGVAFVGLVAGSKQYSRSVALLVLHAFVPQPSLSFDTPINLNGDRFDNRVENLMWRPRWFAVEYNRQRRDGCHSSIKKPLYDVATGEVFKNSSECAMKFGLLEGDIYLSIVNPDTFVWPTYQVFDLVTRVPR